MTPMSVIRIERMKLTNKRFPNYRKPICCGRLKSITKNKNGFADYHDTPRTGSHEFVPVLGVSS